MTARAAPSCNTKCMHGAFHDVPAKFLIAEMARRYPSLKDSRGRSARRHGERGSARARLIAPLLLHCGIAPVH